MADENTALIGAGERGGEVVPLTHPNARPQIRNQGNEAEDLVFFNPEDYDSAPISGGFFTTEDKIADHPETVQAVVSASLHGWTEAFADPGTTAKIMVKYNEELDPACQVRQIKAMRDIACAGPTLKGKFGETDPADHQTAQKILLNAKLIDNGIDPGKAYTNRFVDAAPAEFRRIACGN